MLDEKLKLSRRSSSNSSQRNSRAMGVHVENARPEKSDDDLSIGERISKLGFDKSEEK